MLTCGLQMVDKLWDDWQRRRPENFWAFQGGSVGSLSVPGLYEQFPNGGPPFLNVRFLSPRPAIVADLFLTLSLHFSLIRTFREMDF